MHLHYGWDLTRLPASCECGTNFTIDHALSCKKGGFISLRHNKIRNITASLLRETCRDVRIEPCLQHLTGETFEERTAVMTDEARVDVSARGFWTTGQTAFLDIRVFNPMAKRYVHKNLNKASETNEKEKKRKYCRKSNGCRTRKFYAYSDVSTRGYGTRVDKILRKIERNDFRKETPTILIGKCLDQKEAVIRDNKLCLRLYTRKPFVSLRYTNLERSIEKDPRFSEDSSKI